MITCKRDSPPYPKISFGRKQKSDLLGFKQKISNLRFNESVEETHFCREFVISHPIAKDLSSSIEQVEAKEQIFVILTN